MHIFRCEDCGSDQVSRDANADWDPETQQWVLGAVYDAGFCHKCETERNLVSCSYVKENTE